MKVFSVLFLLQLLIFEPMQAQRVYRTDVCDKQIKTLQVKVADELISDPIIQLGGDKVIEINFDVLNSDLGRYAYNLIHCDANWTQSKLTTIEYMDRFQGSAIEDFANAMSTTVQYTNYRLFFPNQDMRPKVSGNYAIQVYDEEDPSHILFTACFSVFEPLVAVGAKVSGNTDIDTNQSHQQVGFEINDKNFPITYPQTDLKIWVYQNNRRDNAVTDLQPISITENRLTYSNNRKLIFPAGNEYRRFEFLSNKYNGMRVEGVSFHNPFYHVDLMKDLNRAHIPYEYDQDQDGRFFVRCSRCDEPDSEADYYIVHFTLETEFIPDGNVYLSGDLYNNVLDEKSKMGYNPETQRYEKSVLLKQGSYNYQYLFVPNGEQKGYTGPTEGDFFQAENQYSIYVYYCPMGARYDRLIGVTSVRNIMPVL